MIFLTQCFTSALNVYFISLQLYGYWLGCALFDCVWVLVVSKYHRGVHKYTGTGCTFNLLHKCIPRCGGNLMWIRDDETIDTADTEWWEWSVMMISQSLSSSHMLWIKLGSPHPWWHYLFFSDVVKWNTKDDEFEWGKIWTILN